MWLHVLSRDSLGTLLFCFRGKTARSAWNHGRLGKLHTHNVCFRFYPIEPRYSHDNQKLILGSSVLGVLCKFIKVMVIIWFFWGVYWMELLNNCLLIVFPSILQPLPRWRRFCGLILEASIVFWLAQKLLHNEGHNEGHNTGLDVTE